MGFGLSDQDLDQLTVLPTLASCSYILIPSSYVVPGNQFSERCTDNGLRGKDANRVEADTIPAMDEGTVQSISSQHFQL